MDELPRIPTPFSARMRELRVRYLPIVGFVIVIISLACLFRNFGGTGGVVQGVAEGVRSTVTSPQPGKLDELLVHPYQMVKEGQPIAVLRPVDPRARLDLLQSALQLERMRMEPSVAQQNAMNFERVRVEFLRLKQEVAVAKINLERADNQLRRDSQLFKEQLLSEDLYDLTLKTRDMYKAEVEEKGAAVAEIEARLKLLRTLGEPQLAAGTNVNEVLARLDAEQALAHTNWGPITLFSPIDGIVQAVCRHQSEFVLDGEPLIIINSQRSDQIVGYLRQPYSFQPEIGMKVQVITREQKRQKFPSEIIQIGAQVEIITNALAFVRQGTLVDAGLPIVVQIPPFIKVRPGELVDIAIERSPVPARTQTATSGFLSRLVE